MREIPVSPEKGNQFRTYVVRIRAKVKGGGTNVCTEMCQDKQQAINQAFRKLENPGDWEVMSCITELDYREEWLWSDYNKKGRMMGRMIWKKRR